MTTVTNKRSTFDGNTNADIEVATRNKTSGVESGEILQRMIPSGEDGSTFDAATEATLSDMNDKFFGGRVMFGAGSLPAPMVSAYPFVNQLGTGTVSAGSTATIINVSSTGGAQVGSLFRITTGVLFGSVSVVKQILSATQVELETPFDSAPTAGQAFDILGPVPCYALNQGQILIPAPAVSGTWLHGFGVSSAIYYLPVGGQDYSTGNFAGLRFNSNALLTQLSDSSGNQQATDTRPLYTKAQNLSLRLDDNGFGLTYVGEAAPGAATSAASWRIKRIDETSSPDVIVLWADGNSNLDNIWDNRASLSYS